PRYARKASPRARLAATFSTRWIRSSKGAGSRAPAPETYRPKTKAATRCADTQAGRLTTKEITLLMAIDKPTDGSRYAAGPLDRAQADPSQRDRRLARRGSGGPRDARQAGGPRPHAAPGGDLRAADRSAHPRNDRASRRGSPRRGSRGGRRIR